ncbi:inorganic phosphate transporter [Halorubrum luteum]
MDAGTVVLIVVALAASFFAAWTIGAGSSGSTPFAPAVGANAITTMRAAFLVGVLAFAGAVLQGAAITETIGEGLIEGVTLSPLAAAVALVIASVYIAAGVFEGYPIATAFAITGSIVGVGLAMGGDPAWGTYAELVAYWLVTPVAVAPPVYAITKLLRSDAYRESVTVALLAGAVGAVVANMEFLLLGPPGEQASVATAVGGVVPGPALVGRLVITVVIATAVGWIVYRDADADSVRAQRRLLLGLGALMAFTAGGGKVGLAVGPLLPLAETMTTSDPITPVLLFGGVGMLLGTWMAATRMIKALTQDYSMLGPRRAIAIFIPSFVIAQVGIALGLPMSFNQIFIASIAGTGYAVGSKTVSERKFLVTAVAWVGSIAFGLAVGYGVYAGISGVTETT